ncbi:MAG: NUDIX domain-containing protein [Patescibacteria group bacterium]
MSQKTVTPKICYTAAGALIHDNKMLLIKHAKLGLWLAPGGHIEENELPHQAAEREVLEETDVAVQVIDPFFHLPAENPQEFYPSPLTSNLHWVSQENYQARLKDGEEYQRVEQWQRGCEQHFNALYLVLPTSGVEYTRDTVETTDIGWFTKKELQTLDVLPTIRQELSYVFDIYLERVA